MGLDYSVSDQIFKVNICLKDIYNFYFLSICSKNDLIYIIKDPIGNKHSFGFHRLSLVYEIRNMCNLYSKL